MEIASECGMATCWDQLLQKGMGELHGEVPMAKHGMACPAVQVDAVERRYDAQASAKEDSRAVGYSDRVL